MATPFNSYSFCNGIIASAKLPDFVYFPITILYIVCKSKRNASEKVAFLLRPIFAIFCRKYIAAF